MPLIYSLVSRSIHVLAEYTASGLTGNFSTVSRVLLKKIPEQDNKCSYIYDKYVFHYMVTDGLTYLCMSDQDFSRPLAFQFLNDIKDRFQATYGDRAKTAIAFAFNADFARVLQAQMEKYNSEGDPKIARIRQQLGEVKDVMMENIDRVLLRGEKIELLVDKTEVLEQVRGETSCELTGQLHAFKFHRGARQLKRQMCMKNLKWIIAIILVLGIIIYIILAIACSGADLPKCHK